MELLKVRGVKKNKAKIRLKLKQGINKIKKEKLRTKLTPR